MIVCAAPNTAIFLSPEPIPIMGRHYNQCAQRMQMEMKMLAPLELEPIALAARSVHRIDNGKGTKVTCVTGVVCAFGRPAVSGSAQTI